MEDITLSSDQQECLLLIGQGRNMLISGAAGTGKSLLISRVKASYEGVHITASTGLAAINIDGMTVHSWAGIYNMGLEPRVLVHKLPPNARYRIQTCKKLIIDEVSMISDILLDYLDELFRMVRGINESFGGIQVLMFGDFLQLPPVNTNGEKYCFLSKAFRLANIEKRILNKNFRQSTDLDFVTLLGRLRYAEFTPEDIRTLRSRDLDEMENPELGHNPVYLFGSNEEVDYKNKQFYDAIDSEEVIYEAAEDGEENYLKQLNNNAPCKRTLKLKLGCQVMLLDNRFSSLGLVNGSVGKLVGWGSLSSRYETSRGTSQERAYSDAFDLMQEFNLPDRIPVVEFDNGTTISIPYNCWARTEVGKDKQSGQEIIITRARLIQISIRQSWALTIHKSQGMTLDCVVCDFKKIFAEGQIYVAISRVRNLAGLFIKNLDPYKIKANKELVMLYKNLNKSLKALES